MSEVLAATSVCAEIASTDLTKLLERYWSDSVDDEGMKSVVSDLRLKNLREVKAESKEVEDKPVENMQDHFRELGIIIRKRSTQIG